MKDLFSALAPGSREWSLAESVDFQRLPAHIAVIMDGNGRWAKRRGLPRAAGHRAGVEAVRTAVDTCARLGLEALTLYAFSTENWKRPRAEVDMLWRLLRIYLRKELPEIVRNNIQFTCIGRTAALPPRVRAELESAVESTAANSGMRLNVAINYSGRAEIVDAVNALLDDARLEGRLERLRIGEETLASRLYTAGLPDPDLLIRTSGEMRISNFLLWQIAYSEIYVTATLWPDFRRTDLFEAILDYQKRDRRFGGLGESRERDPLAARRRKRSGPSPPRARVNRARSRVAQPAMKRVLTSLVLAPIFVYVTLWAPTPVFLAVVAIVAVLCFHEYAGLVSNHGLRPPGIFGYAAGLLVLFLPRPDWLLLVLIALLALALALASRDLADALPFAAALLLGVLYVFGCLRGAIALRGLPRSGPFWLLFALSVNWAGDIAAFYVGRAIGRHKLAPAVSPAKTWEGAAASTLLSLLYAYFYFSYLLKEVPLAWVFAIAAAGNIAGQIGDLCESAIKRGAGVKDSGSMLPGHGGWLDRIDSSLFALPVIYYISSLFAR